ncbi:MAG TPA: hypothetical protein DEP84_14225 [Chloroflexi bacterium]|nr:hypothetical protein [Chloroflexota bacterium]
MRHKVLIPLDGSEFSRQILPHMQRFLGPDGAEFLLLRVAPLPEGLTAPPPRPSVIVDEYVLQEYESSGHVERARHPIDLDRVLVSSRGSLLDELQGDVSRLCEAGYVVTATVRFGDPADEIVSAAGEEGADLIAMTTHGRTGLRRLVLGSVAERVLHRVSVPVLLVRPFEPPAGEAAVSES